MCIEPVFQTSTAGQLPLASYSLRKDHTRTLELDFNVLHFIPLNLITPQKHRLSDRQGSGQQEKCLPSLGRRICTPTCCHQRAISCKGERNETLLAELLVLWELSRRSDPGGSR